MTIKSNVMKQVIPQMWLVGRTQTLGREGLNPKAAYVQAIADWNRQEELELQFLRERAQ